MPNSSQKKQAFRIDKISRRTLYWTFQACGWLAMLFYELINYIGLGFFTIPDFLSLTGLTVIAMLYTHLYRYIINQSNFFQHTYLMQFFWMLVSWVGLSLIIPLTGSFMFYLIDHRSKINLISLNFFMNVINWSRYLAVWLLMYHISKFLYHKAKADVKQLHTALELQTAQLEILRLQLNPHFLFNALNSIRSLIITDGEQARNATTLLSQLLRHTLNYERQRFISIQQEAEIVGDYLALEKIRFEERLEYKVEVDPEVLELFVPPSILLTLAENAIKHGINKLVKGGFISVEVKKMGESIYITVVNTGQISINEDKARQGIGIANLNKRFRLFYTDAPVLSLKNINNNSVAATVQLPLTSNF
jgi:two-component system, LytTR family, sensor kinase